jgi:hypothetical protein
LLTIWVRAVAVLLKKLASPVYEAAMVCMPGANEAVLKVAVVTPPVVVTLAGLPALLPSIRNCTVPLGVPLPGELTLTVAAKLTNWPATDGTAEAFTTVLVEALMTVWVKEPVLVEKLLPSE